MAVAMMVSVGTLGCGSVVTNEYRGETLLTLTGELTAAGSSNAPVSMTLIWAPYDLYADGPATALSCNQAPVTTTTRRTTPTGVTQSVTYQPSFPIRFSLPLTSLPPPSARIDLAALGGSGTLAFGFVAAYTDQDGDGALRLATPTAPSEPLQAMSVYTGGGEVVVFLDGVLPSPLPPILNQFPANAPQGFSVARLGGSGAAVSLPASTPIDLQAIGDAELVLCSETDTTVTVGGAMPGNALVTRCSPDSYAWVARSFLGNSCVTSVQYGLECGQACPSGRP